MSAIRRRCSITPFARFIAIRAVDMLTPSTNREHIVLAVDDEH